jgi:hypothetical protein
VRLNRISRPSWENKIKAGERRHHTHIIKHLVCTTLEATKNRILQQRCSQQGNMKAAREHQGTTLKQTPLWGKLIHQARNCVAEKKKDPCAFERHSSTQVHGTKIHSEMERPGVSTCGSTKSEEGEIRLGITRERRRLKTGRKKRSATAESRRTSEIWAKLHGTPLAARACLRSDLTAAKNSRAEKSRADR